MTIQELERACDDAVPPDFSRHELESPPLTLRRTFFPFGFPVQVETNAVEVLDLLQGQWGQFTQRRQTDPILCSIRVLEGGETECPPEPTYRLVSPLLLCLADNVNYSVVDLARSTVTTCVTSAALEHTLYVTYFLLSTPLSCITARHVTAVHAACVALDGKGVLLCGDSGAGKSTLSFACARKGWTYISDDASYLPNGGTGRIVTGNCHQVRLRPTGAALFPEVEDAPITPRAAGKPSIEIPIASFRNIVCAETARVDFLVFLKRGEATETELVPYRKDVARGAMQQMLFGPSEARSAQLRSIEQLLTAEVFELRYSDLDGAVGRLRTLVREGA